MNSRKLVTFSAITFAMLRIADTHAEAYEGVSTITSSVSRAEVAAQAVAAAHTGNIYSDSMGGSVHSPTASRSRESVHAEAVAAAHVRHFGLSGMAFYRDQIPSAYRKPAISFDTPTARTADAR
jgi:hypothetical protein